MGILRRNGKRKKPLINYKAWMDYTRLKNQADSMKTFFLTLFFSKPSPTPPELFEDVEKQFNLTSEDLLAKQKIFFRMSLLMCVGIIFFTIYSIYQFSHTNLLAGAISLSVTLICAALCFRYHFWYFQIKQRKLGCSVKEWFYLGLLRR